MDSSYKAPEDLKIKRHRTSLIFSPEPKTETMFLSNIDQVLNFDVQTIHFFEAHPGYSGEEATREIERALEKLLVHYGFLSGRIRVKARLEVECNNAGVGFVEATSECSLQEIGDLVYPNPGFEELVTRRMPSDDHPLCIVQITSFTCGGFAMGIQTNHATFDGSSFKTFLENLAAVANNKPLAAIPCNNRELLSARNPPLISFPHPELLKLNTAMCETNVFDTTTSNDLHFNVFRLSPTNIKDLKIKAQQDLGLQNQGPIKANVTGFNVVAAHIWRCKALSYDPETNLPDRESTLLFAIDIRRRLTPTLPDEYAGNAVLTAYAREKKGEIEVASLGKLVEKVTEGSLRMTDEYARSVVDWGEENKGFPNGEFLISSWWRLGLDRVEYPWGRPKYSCPLVHKRKDIVLLFPDCCGGDGVNVLVALPRDQMILFQSLFQDLL